tara:strand:- start:78 stop:479 length:402 start_codon:yes stop_codon:yes gene_type:complete
MEHYLYFAGIDGGGGAADGTAQAGLWPASRFIGVEPISATTTGIYFRSGKGDVDGGGGGGDLITVTHADTHATADSYHRAKLIAETMCELANASPHKAGQTYTVIDADESIYAGQIKDITGDSGFDIVITLDS